MKKMFTKLKDFAAHAAIVFIMGWMCFALSLQIYFLAGMALGQEEKLQVVSDELMVRITATTHMTPAVGGMMDQKSKNV